MNIGIGIVGGRKSTLPAASLNFTSVVINKSDEPTLLVGVSLPDGGPASVCLRVEGGKGKLTSGDPLEDYGLGANYEVSGTWLRSINQASIDGYQYESAYTVVQFASGETSKTISLKILNNGKFELDRVLTLSLVSAIGCNVSGGARTITVIDDTIPKTNGYRNIINLLDPNKDYDSAATARSGLIAAVNDGATETRARIMAAINWLHSNGDEGKGGIIYYPDGTYLFGTVPSDSSIQLWENITHWGQSKAGTIIKVADSYFTSVGGYLFSTNTNYYDSGGLAAADSGPFGFVHLTLDGNPAGNVGAGEQRHLIKFFSNSSGGGQLVGVWEDTHFIGGSDGVNLSANSMLTGYQMTHLDAARDTVCISGGNSDVWIKCLHAWNTDTTTLPGGFETEIVSAGYNDGNGAYRHTVWLENIIQRRLESTSPSSNEHSTFYANRLTIARGMRTDYSSPNCSLLVENSTIRTQLLLDKDGYNDPRFYVGNPNNSEFKNCTFILDEIQTGTSGVVPLVYAYDGGTPADNPVLKLTGCDFQVDLPSAAGKPVYAASNYGNLTARVTKITFDGCTFSNDIDYIHGNFNSKWGQDVAIRNCLNIAAKGIARIVQTNPSFNPGYTWSYVLEGNTLSSSCQNYLYATGNYAMPGTWTDADSDCAAPVLITVPGTTGISAWTLTGGKTIHGTSHNPATDGINAMPADQYTDEVDTWTCTALGYVGHAGTWELAA